MTISNPDPESISAAVLARYFAGRATPEELAVVHAWIGDDPARRAAVAEWREAWQADTEHLDGAYDAETAWVRLSERLGLLTLVRGERPVRGPRHIRFTPSARSVPLGPKVGRWAAAIVMLAIGGAGAWHLVGRGRLASSLIADAATRDYATSRGQRGIVRLPDGSEVMLNVASRLTIPAAFGAAGQPRALELDGEAQFTVVHDATRPFTVHTAHGVTRDIGTRFDVRAYAGDREEQIAVVEGEVAVRGDSTAGEIRLRAGQAAALDRSGRATRVRQADIDQALAWTQGRLELEGVTLAEAARRIGRWYDLDVQVADAELAQRRVVGSYRDEPVAQVLGIIAAAVGARYELRGRSAAFVPRDGR